MNLKSKKPLGPNQVKGNKKVSFVIYLCFIFIFVFSCSSPSESKIIGKWNIDHTDGAMMEFFKDGTCKSYTPFRFGPQLMYSSVKMEDSNYKIVNKDILELNIGNEKSKIVQIKIKFSDENSMTLSASNGETLFALTRAR